MKPARTFLAAVALWGCAQSEPTSSQPRGTESPPSTAPENPPTGSSDVWIWLMVIDRTGVCISGATTEVVAGQHTGQPVTQQTPCDAWAYSGGVEYHELTAGVPMTIRATAPGYATEDTTITPGGGPVSAITIVPRRLH
jgi:hypothetical protein